MTDTTASSTAPGSARDSYAELIGQLRQTFESGRTRPAGWRRAQLQALLGLLSDHEAALIAALKEDLGRPVIEAFGADVGVSRLHIKYLLKHFEGWMRPTRVNPGLLSMPGRAEVIHEPLGVALVISPWNYPIQLLVEPMAAALAAGNCVIAKPSELAPACSSELARLIPQYLDDDAVVVVEGGVPETTALLENRFDHIFFTGSTNVGRVVMKAAAEHLTPVTLELGGKSPTIVCADADLDVAARRIVWAKLLNAGQTCIAPDYVLAERAIRDRLVAKMGTQIEAFYGADPKKTPDLGRIVNERHHGRLMDLIGSSGGTIAHGGEADIVERYLEPTIVVDPDVDSELMSEEIFGPVLPVLAVDSVEEAIAFVNDRPKPLALYLYSRSKQIADRVLARTSSGGACVNHSLMHIVPDTMPFGGVGSSGMGSYHGKAGFDTFSHHKSVMRKPTFPDPGILYPPYTGLKEKLVRWVFS
ncbi:MAG TPA: aldehyde dehydrogenase family protein [Microthrixaceae bacterium]|nr:aldehyde dehydrogenase family protein [Microthrixaceae bacterium]